MERGVRLGVCAVLMVVLGAQGLRADVTAVRKALSARYAASDAALRKKDARVLMGMVTPDFTVKTAAGQTLTAKQLPALLEQEFAAIKEIKDSRWRILDLKVKGNVATVKMTQTLSGVILGQDQKTHTLSSTNVSVDTWVRTSAGWKLRKSVELSEKTLVDGKPVTQGGGEPSGKR
ncbi:MAG: nuclear transport factor 2 family protein [Chthonomonadales bacterium]